MSFPGHTKLTFTAVVMFNCLTRFHAYLVAGAKNEGDHEADDGYEHGDESEEYENGKRGSTKCIRDCRGKKDGDYQSCRGCSVYASCTGGRIIDDRPCPANLVWDDVNKYCDYTSPTCDGEK